MLERVAAEPGALALALSKRHLLVMGFAVVGIYCAHVYALVPVEGVVAAALSLGNLGVDVFFLMTGFGMSYSMARGGSAASFYVRRLVRVAIPYLCISVPHYLFAKMDFRAAVKRSEVAFGSARRKWKRHQQSEGSQWSTK